MCFFYCKFNFGWLTFNKKQKKKIQFEGRITNEMLKFIKINSLQVFPENKILLKSILT